MGQDDTFYMTSFKSSSPFIKFSSGMMNLQNALQYSYLKPLTKDLFIHYSALIREYSTPSTMNGIVTYEYEYDMPMSIYMCVEANMIYRYYTKIKQTLEMSKIRYNNKEYKLSSELILEELMGFIRKDMVSFLALIKPGSRYIHGIEEQVDKALECPQPNMKEYVLNIIELLMGNEYDADDLTRFVDTNSGVFDIDEMDDYFSDEPTTGNTKVSITGADKIFTKYLYCIDEHSYKDQSISARELILVFMLFLVDGLEMYIEEVYWGLKREDNYER